MEGLLKATSYLEQCEMIHGNISPENLFLFGNKVKLMDNFWKTTNFLEIQY